MKIRKFTAIVLGPVLPILPVTCMHFGDGHRSGDNYFSTPQLLYQFLIYDRADGGGMGREEMPIDLGGEKGRAKTIGTLENRNNFQEILTIYS